MNDGKRLSRLQRVLALESSLYKEWAGSRLARRLGKTLGGFLAYIENVGKSEDLALIIAVEKAIVENELVEYANSKGMVSSLNAALEELTAIEGLLEIVGDPVKYSPVNQSHILSKNREKGLPLDEARQAFKSHTARLSNLDKSRLAGLTRMKRRLSPLERLPFPMPRNSTPSGRRKPWALNCDRVCLASKQGSMVGDFIKFSI
ncbi:MAG: hypothetical protein LBL72_04580 [Candidatus Accumulibacter sp.]|jgi:hypothetical protein|nr:hypothetical protein [Accumulibacter sp.]